MCRHSARWSLFSCLLLVNVICLTSATLVDSQNSDFSDKPNGNSELTDLVQVDRSHPSSNQTNPVFASQHNPPNTTDSLTSDPFKPNRLKKRWSKDYGTSQAERRTFYPFKAVPRPQPNNGLPFKGYRPPKAPHIGYPVARPPYQPQPNRPTQPPHSYGVPKPTGYPASNYHQQEIYITYPPATTVRYPQTTGNSNLGGSYGPVITPSYVTATPETNTGYRPPKPTAPYVPSKPIYEVPTSYPNPSYVTNKPDYYLPSTTQIPYITPNPSYPLPLDQGVYPGYPVSPNGGGSYNPGPGYPSPSLETSDSHKPHYPVPPSSGYPSYPASSGGSYHGSAPVGSPPPIFVFIPKPGYYNTQHSNSKPGNYHKPSGTYPVHYHSTPRPSGIPNGQYYPAPVPIKHPKPVGVYPPAKAPSTAYGLPKPQRPTQQYPTSFYSGKTGAGTSAPNYNSASYAVENQLNIQPSYDNNKGGILATQLYQSTTPSISQSVTPAQPNVFQRGNISQRPANSPATYSTVVHDFIALPDQSGESQLNSFNKQNKSWIFGAESSLVLAVTELPDIIGNLPYYQDEFRVPFQSINKRPIKNDCGGSWVVLNQPPAKYVDPTQVQVEPIYLPVQEAAMDGFHSNFNGPFFRSPKEADDPIPTPRVNELSVVDPNTSNAYESYVPDFLIFATTPYTELSSTTGTTERIWRKPNGLVSSVSFFPSPSIQDDLITASEQRSSSSGITVVIPESTDPVKTLTSTENSVILSLNANNLQDDDSDEIDESEQGKRNSPSPFLAAVFSSVNKENDDDDSDSVVNETTDNNLGTNANSSVTEDSLIRHLRSANLRVLSSLINQAEIASLFQDQEYTLMAPSNAAFNKISASQRRRWITRPDTLREVLLNHVVPNHLNSSSFENEATHVTLAGSHRLRINIYNATDNRDIVTTVNGARFLTNDLRIGKLLVHIVDRVLMPSPTPSQTILDILNDGVGLQASLLGPALTKVLSSDSPLSVFIPTTEAFLSISQDEQRLFLNNETAFHNLLWYHIVPGTYYSEGLEDGQWLSTLHGVGRLRVDLTRQNRKSKLARINGEANVIESDVSASNGVVHFIDRILTDILF
ncbi:uncharacterized protein LOC116916210 isoform X3 [Daphnia magna]|uniref:uncharacterized protein LOC116916210 isoform X3 n=1 Tax=Daphnia magna TaxID=35525 RepID=UPI001E1BCB8A|nr:uncharacterized protein LOC116916210 isoform X3 [Daphnia magna]